MAWQIALQLVRQAETVEPAVASVQAIETKEAEIDFGESSQSTAGKNNSELLKDSSHELMSETSKEVDKEKPDLLADHSQSPANQSMDKEVL